MAIAPDVRPLPVQLNLNVRGLKASATLAINERSHELRAQGQTVCKLGLGQSPFPVVPPVVEALRSNTFQKNYLGWDAFSSTLPRPTTVEFCQNLV